MVYTIGETVLDIIFKGDEPVTAKAGGSMLNSAVSLGRAGIPVTFISETGADQVGKMIIRFLEENNVSVKFIQSYPDARTPLALAFLDEQGDASYSFYKSFPEKRLTGGLPDPGPDDLVLFGSFFSISPDVRNRLEAFLSVAKKNNALIIYDPNFRKPHLKDLRTALPRIYENIDFAAIIRGSDEDFLNIFGAREAKTAFERMTGKVLICTKNKEDVEIISPFLQMKVPVPSIETVSTIGAGDAFNAGIIFKLVSNKIRNAGIISISADEWKSIIMSGIRFASDVCQGMDNYISANLFQAVV